MSVPKKTIVLDLNVGARPGGSRRPPGDGDGNSDGDGDGGDDDPYRNGARYMWSAMQTGNAFDLQKLFSPHKAADFKGFDKLPTLDGGPLHRLSEIQRYVDEATEKCNRSYNPWGAKYMKITLQIARIGWCHFLGDPPDQRKVNIAGQPLDQHSHA